MPFPLCFGVCCPLLPDIVPGLSDAQQTRDTSKPSKHKVQ